MKGQSSFLYFLSINVPSLPESIVDEVTEEEPINQPEYENVLLLAHWEAIKTGCNLKYLFAGIKCNRRYSHLEVSVRLKKVSFLQRMHDWVGDLGLSQP